MSVLCRSCCSSCSSRCKPDTVVTMWHMVTLCMYLLLKITLLQEEGVKFDVGIIGEFLDLFSEEATRFRHRSTLSRLVRIPGFFRFLVSLHRQRIIWPCHPTPTARERDVLGKWVATSLRKTRRAWSALRGRVYLNERYIETFRVNKVTFNWLLELSCP